MSHSSPGRARLHALIGDALHELPPHFVATLERALAGLQARDTASDRVVPLFRPRPAAHAGPGEATMSLRRRFTGLQAILQVLEASNLCRPGDPGALVLSPPLVEGLMAASRDLLESVDDALLWSR